VDVGHPWFFDDEPLGTIEVGNYGDLINKDYFTVSDEALKKLRSGCWRSSAAPSSTTRAYSELRARRGRPRLLALTSHRRFVYLYCTRLGEDRCGAGGRQPGHSLG
jgi:hypothetical protein